MQTIYAIRRSSIMKCFVVCAGLFAITVSFAFRAQGQEGDLISRVQAATQKFFDEFALMRYDEYMTQEKLRENGKIDYERQTVFDSIIRMRFEEGILLVDEQQITIHQPQRVDARPLLSTRGFSALAMVFHPYYASAFQFTIGEPDQSQGKLLQRIDFAHIPDKPSPWLYQILGGDRPLDLSGTAWVDPATGEIYKIEASVDPKSTDLAFRELRAELDYAPVLLRDETAPRLLPDKATIDLETPRQHWRNTYSYEDYRRYRVATSVEGATPQ
jgi:hypothetical protein